MTPQNFQLNCSVCCLNFSPEDVVTQSTKKYIDSESLKLESFSGVLLSTLKSKISSLEKIFSSDKINSVMIKYYFLNNKIFSTIDGHNVLHTHYIPCFLKLSSNKVHWPLVSRDMIDLTMKKAIAPS